MKQQVAAFHLYFHTLAWCETEGEQKPVHKTMVSECCVAVDSFAGTTWSLNRMSYYYDYTIIIIIIFILGWIKGNLMYNLMTLLPTKLGSSGSVHSFWIKLPKSNIFMHHICLVQSTLFEQQCSILSTLPNVAFCLYVSESIRDILFEWKHVCFSLP